MSSFVKFSREVIGVVAVGVGVLAAGWLGWKSYVKVNVPIVQVNEFDEEQTTIVSVYGPISQDDHAAENINTVSPEDDDKVADIFIADAPVPIRKVKKLNKALWSASYQRRLLKTENERARKVELEQQATSENVSIGVDCEIPDGNVDPEPDCASSLVFLQDSIIDHTVVPVEVDLVETCQASGCDLGPDASSLVFVQESCVVDEIFDPSILLVEDDVLLAPVEAAALAEPTPVPACEELPQIAIQHECVVDVAIPQGEQAMNGTPGVVADTSVLGRRFKKPNKALWNSSYQRRLLKRANERAEKAALEQQAAIAVQSVH